MVETVMRSMVENGGELGGEDGGEGGKIDGHGREDVGD
ncbi:hypothetical protein Tco_1342688, partial [Tanacetum coccineum]